MWKVIPSFPLYEASSLGAIRRVGSDKCLNPFLNHKGYLKVRVSNGTTATKKSRFVHCLVLEAFDGPRPSGAEGRHLNGVQAECGIENLAWGTPSQNVLDKVNHGSAKGARNPHSKLDEDTVRMIRNNPR